MKDRFSEERISKLHPKVRKTFTDFINECEETFGIILRVVQGYRTISEQNILYYQGRDKDGFIVDKTKIVTNAKGGQSFHNFGLAIDICAMSEDDKEVNWNYDNSKLQPIAEKYGITWGGNWTHLKDKPHFEINFGHGSSGWKFFLDLHKKGITDKDGYVNI